VLARSSKRASNGSWSENARAGRSRRCALSAKGRGCEVVHSNGRSWVGVSIETRRWHGTFRQSDEMGCAWLVLHACEPLFFKTTGSPPCAEWPGSNGVVVQCLRRVAGFLPLACKAGGIRTSMPGTRALNSSSSSPPFPYCPVSILHSLYYSSSFTLSKNTCRYSPTDYRHTTTTTTTTTTIFQPQQQQHQHYPTLTCPPAQQRAVRHAIVQRIQVLPRVCRFARYTKLQTKRPLD